MTEAEKILKQEDLQEKIEAFIETEIQQFVQQDGGNIELLNFDIDTGVVRIIMQGACSTCPSSIMTLKFGIERRLVEAFPEVKSVDAVSGFEF